MSNLSSVALDGAWTLGWFDGRRGDRAFRDLPEATRSDWLQVTVPGEVHRYLEDHGIISPIEEGLGALAARWVDDAVWYFAREFTIDEGDVTGSAEIVFERLELDAQVYLNGELVATHSNAFMPLRVAVSGLLIDGTNTLRVELNGGLRSVSDLPASGYRNSTEQGLTKRHWLRTGQSQFSWDWSPRLVVVGITGPVRLELRTVPVRIAEVVPLVKLSDDLSSVTVTCRVVCESAARSSVRMRVRVALPGLGITAAEDVTVGPGTSIHELCLDVADPELWWPRGMGAQTLHQVAAQLELDRVVIDTQERSVGFRSIVVDQGPTPGGGRLFRLVVNGVDFFAKGANWVPMSLTPHPVNQGLLDVLLDRAVEANFNFLRVWGGGDYETEDFYRGCDERGIMVWQDFIFACSRYPTSVPDFRTEVTSEATYQIRRLASHASLAVWAGNNEIAWIGLSPGWPGPLVLAEDGVTHAELLADHEFFEKDLPALFEVEDPTRFYQPSSPWSPTDPDHNASHEGDQHPWQVGFENVDFMLYREMDARFPNEGGLLGPASMPAILASLPEEQRSYDSFAWKVHDNQFAQVYADRPMERLLTEWTGVRIGHASLQEYAYWTGLVQGEALTEYIDNFRRRSSTTTGAAVFWMYNDCWPTVRSWSIVDYAGRRSPAFSAVRRAFQPVRVIVVANGTGATVYGCNDTREERTLELEWGTCTLAGEMRTDRRTVRLSPGCAVALDDIPQAEGDPLGLAFLAVVRGDGVVVSRDRLLAGPFAALPWSDPEIQVTHTGQTATFTSPAFVLGVCIDLDGEDDVDDNFFDLYPGIPHTVKWNGDQPPRVLFTGNAART